MRRADVVLHANGRGTRAERRAARRRGMEEDDLNGETEEEEEEEEGWGGRDAHEGVVAESGRSPSRSRDRSRSRSCRSRSGSRGRSRKGRSRDRSSRRSHTPSARVDHPQTPPPPAIPHGILDPEPPARPEALYCLEEGGRLFSNG
jgi:hypothetical protein